MDVYPLRLTWTSSSGCVAKPAIHRLHGEACACRWPSTSLGSTTGNASDLDQGQVGRQGSPQALGGTAWARRPDAPDLPRLARHATRVKPIGWWEAADAYDEEGSRHSTPMSPGTVHCRKSQLHRGRQVMLIAAPSNLVGHSRAIPSSLTACSSPLWCTLRSVDWPALIAMNRVSRTFVRRYHVIVTIAALIAGCVVISGYVAHHRMARMALRETRDTNRSVSVTCTRSKIVIVIGEADPGPNGPSA
jgi:hypothetical protein